MEKLGTIRDPNSLNEHVMVNFDEVIGEPPTAESVPCVWEIYDKAFTNSKSCWYKGLTSVFGVPCAVMWGLKYACVSFNTIWCGTPCVKAMKIGMSSWSEIYSSCVRCLCEPVCDSAFGTVLSRINITQK